MDTGIRLQRPRKMGGGTTAVADWNKEQKQIGER